MCFAYLLTKLTRFEWKVMKNLLPHTWAQNRIPFRTCLRQACRHFFVTFCLLQITLIIAPHYSLFFIFFFTTLWTKDDWIDLPVLGNPKSGISCNRPVVFIYLFFAKCDYFLESKQLRRNGFYWINSFSCRLLRRCLWNLVSLGGIACLYDGGEQPETVATGKGWSHRAQGTLFLKEPLADIYDAVYSLWLQSSRTVRRYLRDKFSWNLLIYFRFNFPYLFVQAGHLSEVIHVWLLSAPESVSIAWVMQDPKDERVIFVFSCIDF